VRSDVGRNVDKNKEIHWPSFGMEEGKGFARSATQNEPTTRQRITRKTLQGLCTVREALALLTDY